MKHLFVLDEGVVICAATLESPQGQPDASASRLVTLIVEICHGLAVDVETYSRWMKQLEALRLQGHAEAPTIFRLLASVSRNADKWQFLSPAAPALPEESDWPSKLQDDAVFIRLAAQCHGVLATWDDPLVQDILARSLSNRYEFSVASVTEALTLASEPST